MSEVIAIVGLGIALFPTVKAEIDKYLQSREIKHELYFSLKTRMDK
jgi:hypothetical protein